MLLSFSPEQAFILGLFQLVLSGLSLMVLLWVQRREKRTSPRLRVLSVGFAFFALAALARVLHFRGAEWPLVDASPGLPVLLLGGEILEVLASGSLALACVLRIGGRHRATALVLFVGALPVVSLVRLPVDAALMAQSILPLTTARAAELLVILAGILLVRRTAGPVFLTALLLFFFAHATAVLAALRPEAIELLWGLDHLLTLAGLVVFVLALEHESRQTALHFFLRLNLTFIVLASSLILAVTEIERRHLVQLSAQQTETLGEFVRGHLLAATARGLPPREALADETVVRHLVGEFGRYPDLRRVQVSLSGEHMALSINERGEIAQDLWSGSRPPSVRVSPSAFLQAPLAALPVVRDGQVLGAVELGHSLERINEQVGWQMQLIFGVFTLFVSVTTVVTGILVVAAERTIGRQHAEIRRGERQLRLAERLASIGGVVDGVAHQINNPAGILVARTDYLLSTTGGSECTVMREDLDTIRRQANRIAKTVKDLLSFTRPSQMVRATVEVNAVLESAIALVRPLAVERGVVLECHLSSELPAICGDADRLEHVFSNLLVNAIQATEAGGSVTAVSTAQVEGNGVEIVVLDTGCGIPPEHLDRIFDPFFTTKPTSAGTGLGLSIAYGIVRDHGGTIDVTSIPGAGSEFRVRLAAGVAGACPHCEDAPLDAERSLARILDSLQG